MVEIRVKKRIAVLFVAVLACFAAHGQMAGLENNPEYGGLLRTEQKLRTQEDSLTTLLARLRADLRANADQRAVLGQSILKLESQLFEVRNQAGIVAGKINAIEQEFVIRNLGAESVPAAADTIAKPAKQMKLADYLRDNMPAQEYAVWQRASAMESGVAGLVADYAANHAQLRALAAAYAVEASALRADSITAQFGALSASNAAIADTVARRWAYIFDNKGYACNLLMDKADNKHYMFRHESGMVQMRNEEAQLRGVYASDAIAFYPLERSFLTGCEIAVAEYAGDQRSVDSMRNALKGVASQKLEKVKIDLKSFINYEDVKITGATIYNVSNPIPEVAVHPHGTVYRILVGTYPKAQPPVVFRNVTPLAVWRAGDGQYRYFAGGFETVARAEEAQSVLLKRGFRTPDITVWIDGVYHNLSWEQRSAAASGKMFRVEVVSAEGKLSGKVLDAIKSVNELGDISRAVSRSEDGTPQFTFVVGVFSDKVRAEELAAAIRATQQPVKVNIVAVAAE